MRNGVYILCSHVDWTAEPFGKVFAYQVFDQTGLQVGSYVGEREGAANFIAGLQLERVSAATLAAIWSKHWPDAAARLEAEKEAAHG